MKIDDIIQELTRIESSMYAKPIVDGDLANLLLCVRELAEHVKAQEPDPINEAEMNEYLKAVEAIKNEKEDDTSEFREDRRGKLAHGEG